MFQMYLRKVFVERFDRERPVHIQSDRTFDAGYKKGLCTAEGFPDKECKDFLRFDSWYEKRFLPAWKDAKEKTIEQYKVKEEEELEMSLPFVD